MNCPNCGGLINPRYDCCDDCNLNIEGYGKIFARSNAYYNKGLRKAQVRDLTGAIVMLKQSLALYKNNSDARNLLALVYYESGEIVEALSQWLISKHLDPIDNEADYFLEQVQNNTTELDEMNQAIKKYNLALEEVKQNNLDMAVIQLRKAISVYPNFLRAIRLLTLLYLDKGELAKAARLITKGLEINRSDEMLLRYKKEILTGNSDEDNSELFEGDTASVKSRKQEKPQAGFSFPDDRPNIKSFLSLLLGVILGIGVVYYLFVPTIKENVKDEYEKKKVDYSSELSAKTATIAQNEKTIASLNKKISELEKNAGNIEEKAGAAAARNTNYSDFFLALETYEDLKSRIYTDDELVALAYQIWKVDSKKITDSYAENKLDAMKEDIYSLAAEKVYKTARNLYDQAMYEAAVSWLSAACDMDPHSDKAVYYLAKSYQGLEQYEDAITHYNRVLEVSPTSTLREYIPQRLKECEEALGRSGEKTSDGETAAQSN